MSSIEHYGHCGLELCRTRASRCGGSFKIVLLHGQDAEGVARLLKTAFAAYLVSPGCACRYSRRL